MRYLNLFKFILPFVLVSLLGCGKTLDTANIESTIKDGIAKQGGTSLKSVICPDSITPEAGKSFECVGVLDSGAGFPISVKQQDAQGNIFWEATSVKGLINMAQLQTEFEQGLKKEIGQASIDCGKAAVYRSVKPGETFECQLIKRDAKSAVESAEKSSDSSKPATKRNDTIQVTIQPSGDINWQRIINVADTKLSASTTTPAETPKPTESAKPEATDSNQSAASPAAKSPEDFLKQPGATDDFE